MVRRDRQVWADVMALEGEQRLQNGQYHDTFANFQQLRSCTSHFFSLIVAANDTLISDSAGKLVGWRELTLLNRH